MSIKYLCSRCFDEDEKLSVVDVYHGVRRSKVECPVCGQQTDLMWTYSNFELKQVLKDMKEDAKQEYEDRIAELNELEKKVKAIK